MSVAEVITELLDASTMSRLLKLAMVKYKGRLQFNASGAGSFTMLEVADRLGLNVERAKRVPCCLELQERVPTPPPYTYDLRMPAALSLLVCTFILNFPVC